MYRCRSYRGPELLFGEHPYDPYALDKWALGCTFAQVYTPLASVSLGSVGGNAVDIDRLDSLELLDGFTTAESDAASDSDSDLDSHADGRRCDATPEDRNTVRQTLFDSSRGDIGLIWSIMRIKGKPTPESWPVSSQR